MSITKKCRNLMSKRLAVLMLTVFVFSSVPSGVNAQSSSKQGALLYYFSKFIQWPSGAADEYFVIGVYGDVDVYNGVAKALAGKIIEGKPVAVERYSTVNQVGGCQVLYIAPNKSSNFYRAESLLGNNNTLIITQKTGLGKKGSHINLTIVDGKMKFELNKDRIAKAGLKVSGALIKQAIII